MARIAQISTRTALMPRGMSAGTRITILTQVAQRTFAIHTSAPDAEACDKQNRVFSSTTRAESPEACWRERLSERRRRSRRTCSHSEEFPGNAGGATFEYHEDGTCLGARADWSPWYVRKPSNLVSTPAANARTPAGRPLEQRRRRGDLSNESRNGGETKGACTSFDIHNAHRETAKTGSPHVRHPWPYAIKSVRFLTH